MLLARPTSQSISEAPSTSRHVVGGSVPLPGADYDDANDIVIDLTGATPATSIGTSLELTVRHRRMWFALGAVAVAAVVLAAGNFAIGMRWRSAALAAQDRAVRATADVAAKQEAVVLARAARDVAELRREAMAKQLAVSEADVAALEARVAALASDKARVEDYSGAITPVASDAQIRSLQAQADSCVAQVAALRTVLQVDEPASPGLREVASAAQASCEQVRADAEVLAAGE
jgi:hypothetical protein